MYFWVANNGAVFRNHSRFNDFLFFKIVLIEILSISRDILYAALLYHPLFIAGQILYKKMCISVNHSLFCSPLITVAYQGIHEKPGRTKTKYFNISSC